MSRRTKTKFTGVFVEHCKTRQYRNKADQRFYIVYQLDKKCKWVRAGYLSEGMSAFKASQIRAERIKNTPHITNQAKFQQPMPLTEGMTFGEAWIHFKEHKKYLKSLNDYMSIYNIHLTYLDNTNLQDISVQDIVELRNKLQNINKKPQTVTHAIGLIRNIFNYIIKAGLYHGNNPVNIDLPKKDNARIRFLEKKEANLLLTTLKSRSKYVYYISIMSLYTGMRLSEITSLKWSEINMEQKIIHILDPKNGKNRVVNIPKIVNDMLIQISPKDKNQPVFPRDKEGHAKPSLHLFKRVVKELGLNDGITDERQKMTFHSLRHTFASWMVMAGTDLYTVSNLLGHSSLQMTKRYAHLSPEFTKRTIATIDNNFGLDLPEG
jgi:integrase